jgi:hypothetical protein
VARFQRGRHIRYPFTARPKTRNPRDIVERSTAFHAC